MHDCKAWINYQKSINCAIIFTGRDGENAAKRIYFMKNFHTVENDDKIAQAFGI